jgi:hypothetical protein
MRSLSVLVLALAASGEHRAVAAAKIAPTFDVLEGVHSAPDRIIVRFEPMADKEAARVRESLPNVKRLDRLLPTSPLSLRRRSQGRAAPDLHRGAGPLRPRTDGCKPRYLLLQYRTIGLGE